MRNCSDVTMLGSSSAMRTLCAISVPPRASGQRQRKRESRPATGDALHPERAAEMFDDLAADRQAQPGALRPVAAVAALLELLEDDLPVRRVDSRPVVADVDAGQPVLHADVDR